MAELKPGTLVFALWSKKPFVSMVFYPCGFILHAVLIQLQQVCLPNTHQQKDNSENKTHLVFYFMEKAPYQYGFHNRDELFPIDDEAARERFLKVAAMCRPIFAITS